MVDNVAPTVNAGLDQMINEGDTVSFSASFTDPSGADTHTATINWGDGTTEAATVNASTRTVSSNHAYGDNGTYTVTVTVADDDGDSGSDTLIVTVSNRAPIVNAGPDQSANEGNAVSLAPATFTDAGTADTHTAQINWGDGTVEAGAVVESNGSGTVFGSRVYADNGTYTVTVTVTDDEEASASDAFTTTVRNVAPMVNAGNDQTIYEGEPVRLPPATFTDAGTRDTHTAIIDWGDGTVEVGLVDQTANTVFRSHVYAVSGPFTVAVTVTVTDDDGASSSDTFTVISCWPGDLDADGTVDILDVVRALRMLLEPINITPLDMCAADLDKNRDMNILDAIKIMKIATGLIPGD